MTVSRIEVSDRRAGPPHPRAAAGTAPDGRRSPRAVWGHLKSLNARFEASWAGEVIAGVLFAFLSYALFFIGGILDEFAFHAKSREIWAALFPVISKTGLRLRVISTPNGKGNKFYELMTAEDTAWSRHTVDIYQAVEQGLDRDIEGLRRGMADPDAWAQEYELRWLDEASAWLDYDLIGAAEHPAAGLPGLYQGGSCFVGVDIAARNDLFVIWVMEAVGDVLWTREVITRRRISFAEQDQLLDDVFRRYRVVRCRMDQTGMGEKPVEDAKRRHGAARVEGVLFSAAIKLDMATALKEALQDRKARLPAGDVALRADLHSIKSQVGVTGIRRLVADGDSDGHADRFWAGALAVSAGSLVYQPYDYRPVPRGAEDHDRDIRITGGFGGTKGVW